MKKSIQKLYNFASKRKISLLHKDTISSFPSDDDGIISIVPQFIPVSHQGRLKKELLKKNRKDFESKKESWKKEISTIWEEELEIIIIYKLGSKYSHVDVDNLNKYIVDSMKGILFKDDKQVKLIVGRKDKLDVKESRGQHVEKAIIKIDLFKNSKVNSVLSNIFQNRVVDKIPDKE